jgi:hypothetical protein
VTGLSCNPARSRGGGFSNRAPLARPTRRSAGCRIAAGFAQMRWSPPWSAQAQVSPQALLRRRMSWRISVEWRSSSRMPARRIPLGKLHQRADRKSAACSPSMPPAPPRVREETHRPDELTRAAVCSACLVVLAQAPGRRRSRARLFFSATANERANVTNQQMRAAVKLK